MDIFPPKDPQQRARHLESVEDLAVFQDGTASLGGMGPAISDVSGAQRAGIHDQRDTLTETLDATATPPNHEIVIVEIEEIAGPTVPRSRARQVARWLIGGAATAAVLCVGWLAWQRLRAE